MLPLVARNRTTLYYIMWNFFQEELQRNWTKVSMQFMVTSYCQLLSSTLKRLSLCFNFVAFVAYGVRYFCLFLCLSTFSFFFSVFPRLSNRRGNTLCIDTRYLCYTTQEAPMLNLKKREQICKELTFSQELSFTVYRKPETGEAMRTSNFA